MAMLKEWLTLGFRPGRPDGAIAAAVNDAAGGAAGAAIIEYK